MLEHPARFLPQSHLLPFLSGFNFVFSLQPLISLFLLELALLEVIQTQVLQVLRPVDSFLIKRQVSIDNRVKPVILGLLVV